MQNQSLDRRLTTLQGIHESAKRKLMVSEQSEANLREDIIRLEKTIEDSLEKMEGWCSEPWSAELHEMQPKAVEYEKLWKRSTESRKLKARDTAGSGS